MRIIIALFISFNLLSAGFGQKINDNAFHFLEGQIYGGLPVEISISFDENHLTGYSKYGSKGELKFSLEGEHSDEGYTIYEVDETHAVTGVLEFDEEFNQCVWNSVDYKINLPVSIRSGKDNKMTTVDYVTFQSYITVSYPFIDGSFDEKIIKRINETIKVIIGEYVSIEKVGGADSPSHRFSNRCIGINKITLNSEKLISGYINFYDNQKSDVVTITYTYDKDKNEMLDLSKIFKKNFNYSFFLKQYINQRKESMQSLVTPLELTWLKATKFHHYVLTESGIKFFSDYSTIFGCKSFTIPYYEISSSMGQKSITNFIKKRK